jgi:2-ketoarginine methyltransferase
MPDIQAVGVEPSRGAYEAGARMVREMNLQDRVKLVHSDALEYEVTVQPDFLLFGFVLHELYAQIGEDNLVRYLQTIGRKFRDSHVIVMEVDYDIDNHEVMKSPMGRGYYNPYFLLHPFTDQKLLPKGKWLELFAAAGFEVLASEAVDHRVDPSGLGIGMLLRHRGD